jgi:hypothetical protein
VSIVAELWDDFGWIGLLLFGVMLLCMVLLSGAVIYDSRQWALFKADHNCKVVGKMAGSVVTTVGPTFGGTGGVAVGVGSTPDKTGWLCDDGITYWR